MPTLQRPPRLSDGEQKLIRTTADVRTEVGTSTVTIDLKWVGTLRRDSTDPDYVRIFYAGDSTAWVLHDPDGRIRAAWERYVEWQDRPTFSSN